MVTLRLGLLLLPVLAAACAAPPQQVASGTAESVCVREMPTGSTIPVTRCRSQAEVEQERANAEQTRDALRGKATQPGKPGGGGL